MYFIFRNICTIEEGLHPTKISHSIILLKGMCYSNRYEKNAGHSQVSPFMISRTPPPQKQKLAILKKAP